MEINAIKTVGGDNWHKFISTPNAKKFKTEPCAQVSYSVEKDYLDDSKSILAEINGEDIDNSLLTVTMMKINSKYCSKPLP